MLQTYFRYQEPLVDGEHVHMLSFSASAVFGCKSACTWIDEMRFDSREYAGARQEITPFFLTADCGSSSAFDILCERGSQYRCRRAAVFSVNSVV